MNCRQTKDGTSDIINKSKIMVPGKAPAGQKKFFF